MLLSTNPATAIVGWDSYIDDHQWQPLMKDVGCTNELRMKRSWKELHNTFRDMFLIFFSFKFEDKVKFQG